MSVPRVYEMIYAKLQDGLAKKSKFVRYLFDWAVEVGWRRFCRENGLPVESSSRAWLDPFVAGFLDKKVGSQLRAVFGDRIHLYISGGAALSPAVARTFFALGVPIYQGYGMTETSPIISVNKVGHNHPNTVGPALPNIEVRLGEGDELQVRGPTVMKGYWNREEATKAIFTEDGWLRTGDVCTIYPDGNIRITGRIKEIIVTSTGEKVPPADLESAITSDRLFSQCMVVGDDRPFIARRVQDGLRRARPRSRQARVASGPRLPQGRPQAHQDRHRGLPELRRAASGPLHARRVDDRQRTPHAHAQDEAKPHPPALHGRNQRALRHPRQALIPAFRCRPDAPPSGGIFQPEGNFLRILGYTPITLFASAGHF